ncbi:hypothetical protein GCM10010405_23350 [Streptomyces macrosporus]|uniref:Transposase n=1 Tax=Streptomyces macrosporus TaxID=44032 RepID=A0ABN3JWJ0_9ACTN
MWKRTLRAVQADADAEGLTDWGVVSVDSTSCRAHQHAAGLTPARRESPADEACRSGIGATRPWAVPEPV